MAWVMIYERDDDTEVVTRPQWNEEVVGNLQYLHGDQPGQEEIELNLPLVVPEIRLTGGEPLSPRTLYETAGSSDIPASPIIELTKLGWWRLRAYVLLRHNSGVGSTAEGTYGEWALQLPGIGMDTKVTSRAPDGQVNYYHLSNESLYECTDLVDPEIAQVQAFFAASTLAFDGTGASASFSIYFYATYDGPSDPV
jgi:hypothetical protein